MQMTRRSVLTCLLAVVALWTARRGLPGGRRLAASLQRHSAPSPGYGYKEIEPA